MSHSDDDAKAKTDPDSDDEKPIQSTVRSGYHPSEAGRDAPFTRRYAGYQEGFDLIKIDESMASRVTSVLFTESMLKKKKSGTMTPKRDSKESSICSDKSAKKAKGDDRKRKKDSDGGTNSKKFRVISSPSSSDSDDDKPIKPPPTKPAILDLTENGRQSTPKLITSSEDEDVKPDVEKRKKKEEKRKDKDARKKDKEERKKKHEEKEKSNPSTSLSSPSKAKVVDLFAGMEASGNAKRERRQKTWSDPHRISTVGWSTERILGHFKAFSHCYVNPLTSEEVEELMRGGGGETDGISRKKKDRDREKQKKRDKAREEPIYNGDGSPVRVSFDSDDEEGDVVLPKRDKKKNRQSQAESRKCEECGQYFTLSEDAVLSKAAVWCGRDCIDARAAKAFEAIADHDSKVALVRTDGHMINDGPTVRQLAAFLYEFPEFVPMLPEKAEAPKPPPTAAKPPKVISKSSDTIRVGVRRTMGEVLHARVKMTIGCTFRMKECKDMAEKLEYELFVVNAQNAFNKEYRAWFQSFVTAVKSPMNKGFFHRVLAGIISPQRAVTLDERAMMSAEYAAVVSTTGAAAVAAGSSTPAAADAADDVVKMEEPSSSLPSTSSAPAKPPPNAMAIKRIPKLPPKTSGGASNALDAILGDGKRNTTAQHNSHFYDANCDICAAKSKAAADRALREEQEKASAREKKEEHFRKIRESDKREQRAREQAANQAAASSHRSPSPDYGGGGGFDDDDYGGGGGGGGESPIRRPSIPVRFPANGRGDMRRSRSRSRSRSRERDRDGGRKSLRWGDRRQRSNSPNIPEDPWSNRSPLIWRGELSMINNITLVTLRAISNPASFALREFLPTELKVKGRIQHLSFFDYLMTVRTGNVKDICVFDVIKPDTTILETEFNRLVEDMIKTERYLVINLDSCDVVRDGYLVPLARNDEVPAVLLPFSGPGLPRREDRRDMLLLVVTLHTKWVGPLPSNLPQLPAMSSFAYAAEEKLRRIQEAMVHARMPQPHAVEERAYSPSEEYGEMERYRRGGPPFTPPPMHHHPGDRDLPYPHSAHHRDDFGAPWDERDRPQSPVDYHDSGPAPILTPPAPLAPELAYGAAAEEEGGETGCDSLLPPAFFELSRRAAEVRPEEDDSVPEIRCLEDFLLLLNSSSKPNRVKKIVDDYINNPYVPEEEREIAKNAVVEKIRAERKKKDEENKRKEAEAGEGQESRPQSNGSAVDATNEAPSDAMVMASDSASSRDRPFSPSDFDKEDVSFVGNAAAVLNTLRKEGSSENSADSSMGAPSFEAAMTGLNGSATVPQPVPPPILPPGMTLPIQSVMAPPPPPCDSLDDVPPPPPPPADAATSSVPSMLAPPPPPPAMPSGVPQPVPPPSYPGLQLPPPPPPPPPVTSSVPSHYPLLPPNLAMPPPLAFGGGEQHQYNMPPPMGMPTQMMNMPPPPLRMPPGHPGLPMPPPLMGDHSMHPYNHQDEGMEEDGPLIRMAPACPAPIDFSDIAQDMYGSSGTARHGSAGFGSHLPPSMGGPVRATTPELVARALEIKPLPQRPEERRRIELPENSEDYMEFFKSKKAELLSNEGFMGDPTIKPLPRAVQERMERMMRQQEEEDERQRRLEQQGPEPMVRRARGGVKHRERQQKRDMQARERAMIETSKRMGVYEQPLPGAPVAREMRLPPLMAVRAEPPLGFGGGPRGNFDDEFDGSESMMGGGEEFDRGEQGASGYGNGRGGGERMEEEAEGDNMDLDSSMDVSRGDEEEGDNKDGIRGGERNGEWNDDNPNSLLLPPPPPPPREGSMLPAGPNGPHGPPGTPGSFRGRGGGPPPFRGGPPTPQPLFRGGDRGGWNGSEDRRGGGYEDRGWNGQEERGGWNGSEDRGWNGDRGGDWEDDDGGFYGGPPRPLMDFGGPMRGGRGRGGGGPPPPPRGGRGRGGPPRGGRGGGGPPPWRGGGGGGPRGGPPRGGRGGGGGGFRGGPGGPPFRGGPPRGRGGPPPFRGGW